MSNHGIENNEEAFEVPQFEEIEQFFNIKNSCYNRKKTIIFLSSKKNW